MPGDPFQDAISQLSPSMRREWIEIPLWRYCCDSSESPSMRREWIEINLTRIIKHLLFSSPSMRREWIEIYISQGRQNGKNWSPSMRREWIEIAVGDHLLELLPVSLHAEGVD